MRLPAFADYESFRVWKLDTPQSLPAALDIARSHGLSCAAPHVFATGTNFVLGLDDRLILKIFPPLLRRQFVSERAALSQLRGPVDAFFDTVTVNADEKDLRGNRLRLLNSIRDTFNLIADFSKIEG